MIERVEGVNVHEWLDEQTKLLESSHYCKETNETALGIANLLKRMTSENHCMTFATRRKLGFALDEARKNVIARQPIANIIGLVENGAKLALWRRRSAIDLFDNVRNLSRYVIEGRSTKLDDILIEAGKVKEMLDKEDVVKCDNCSRHRCAKRKEVA